MQRRDPAALGRVRWRPGERMPDSLDGPVTATAVFVTGGDHEVIPDWPAGGEHPGVLVDDMSPEGEAHANVDFFARDLVADQVRVGARFLFMAGRRPLADVEILEVFSKEQE